MGLACGDGDATSGYKVMQYTNGILKDNDIATQEVTAGWGLMRG
jgi:hypothetical protein